MGLVEGCYWMNRDLGKTRTHKWQVAIGWFLLLSYAVGAPVYAIVEAYTGLFSERFNYPPVFLYFVSATQFVCALVLFVRKLAPWSSVILSILAVGAVFSHIRIGSAITALPAVAYTALQIWYGIRVHQQNRELSSFEQ